MAFDIEWLNLAVKFRAGNPALLAAYIREHGINKGSWLASFVADVLEKKIRRTKRDVYVEREAEILSLLRACRRRYESDKVMAAKCPEYRPALRSMEDVYAFVGTHSGIDEDTLKRMQGRANKRKNGLEARTNRPGYCPFAGHDHARFSFHRRLQALDDQEKRTMPTPTTSAEPTTAENRALPPAPAKSLGCLILPSD